MISLSVSNSNIRWVHEGLVPNFMIYFLSGGSFPPIQRETEGLPEETWAGLFCPGGVTVYLGPTFGLMWGHCSLHMASLRPRTTLGLFCGLIPLQSHRHTTAREAT